jgi:hypothetical protein
MMEYLEGRHCRRVVLDADMDGDSIRTSYRIGEQFCDVYRREGRKRIRVTSMYWRSDSTGDRTVRKRYYIFAGQYR